LSCPEEMDQPVQSSISSRVALLRKRSWALCRVMWDLGCLLRQPSEARRFINYVGQFRQGRCLLEEVEPENLFPGVWEAPVTLRNANLGDGNVDLLELYLLSAVVSRIAKPTVFEIGTFDGLTTLHLAMNSDAEARILTLDLPRSQMEDTRFPLSECDRKYVDKPEVGVKYRGSAVEHKITQLYGDSAVFDYAQFEGQVDMVFIDGSHQYEYVMEDSRNAFRMLKRTGGVVLWHDYSAWEGVTKAVDELSAERPLRRIKGTTLAVFVS